jgi:hypothetical protein
MKTILLCLTALMAVSGAFLRSSAARADTFTAGEFISYTQADWTFPTNGTAFTLLQNNFDNVYASNSFALDVGVGFSISFTSPNAVQLYIPADSTAGALTSDQANPTTTTSGVFGGDVTALALDVNFSDFGALHGTSSTPLGNLILVNFNPNSTFFGLNGMTVRQFLTLAESELGGTSTLYAFDDIDSITAQITGSFEDGIENEPPVSDFAMEHLEGPPSETSVPAALPLFATGLGAMGLFGWRRKRQAAA